MARRTVRPQRLRDRRRRGVDSHILRRRRQRSGVSWWVVGGLTVAVVVTALAVVSNLGRGGDGVNITSSGPQQVGPLEVSATRLDLGRVSLGRWVNPTFRLRNLGVEPVAITIPGQGVETLEGC